VGKDVRTLLGIGHAEFTFGLICCVIVGAIGLQGYARHEWALWRMRKVWQSWVSVEGRVVAVRDEYWTRRYDVAVYRYRWGGHEYEGDRISYFAVDTEEVNRRLGQPEVGEKIAVYVDPERPSRAIRDASQERRQEVEEWRRIYLKILAGSGIVAAGCVLGGGVTRCKNGSGVRKE
jgi:hypothetical protein